MKVKITHEHIDKAVILDGFKCPVARACSDWFGQTARVGLRYIHLPMGRKFRHNAMNIIQKFDATGEMEPTTLELEEV